MEHFSWKTPLIDTTPQLAQRLTNLDLNFHAIETRRMVFGDFSMCSKGSSNTKKIGSRGAPSEKFFTNSLVQLGGNFTQNYINIHKENTQFFTIPGIPWSTVNGTIKQLRSGRGQKCRPLFQTLLRAIFLLEFSNTAIIDENSVVRVLLKAMGLGYRVYIGNLSVFSGK